MKSIVRRRALAALLAPAVLVGIGADVPPGWPDADAQDAIYVDIYTLTTAINLGRPIDEDVAIRVSLHCTRLLKEVRRRDRAGLR